MARPRKSVAEHKLAGTYRADRHAPKRNGKTRNPPVDPVQDAVQTVLREYPPPGLLWVLRHGELLPDELQDATVDVLRALHAAVGGEEGLRSPSGLPSYDTPSWLAELLGDDA